MSNSASNSRRLDAAPTAAHEHGWRVESRHATSAGQVLYVRCDACGTRRVDFQERADLPPTALSVELRPRCDVIRRTPARWTPSTGAAEDAVRAARSGGGASA